MTQELTNYSVDLSTINFDYDVVVIGSGMGGSTTAYALTKKGLKVLLIEKGNIFSSKEKIKGVEEESTSPEDRLRDGKWPTKLDSTVNGKKSSFYAPLGCGTGGSTLLYGGAVERLHPMDFEQRVLPNGEKVEWPYSYKDIQPYYQSAETLFNVHGSADALEPEAEYFLKKPLPLNGTDQYFFTLFEKSGLHPYHLHISLKKSDEKVRIEDVAGALECCLLPAIETGNLDIAPNCEVLQLKATKNEITNIVASQHGKTHKIQAKNIVLAAGAYFTPVILLRSTNTHWPTGLANHNDLVGRNLMFHVSDFIGIWSTKRHSKDGAEKTIAFRDFYSHENEKLGELQSTGKSAQFGYILYFLRLKLERNILGRIPVINQLTKQFLRIPAFIASKLFRDAAIFASIIEDYPKSENRVTYSPDTPSGMHFEYTIDTDLKTRVSGFRKLVKDNLKTRWVINFNNSISLNFGHPCGTCKAGTNPKDSVINTNGRVHGLQNLYITDSSFMPTSGGTNPSLTVAANALRTADHIYEKILSDAADKN